MQTDDSRFDKEVVNTIKGVKMVSDIILDFEKLIFYQTRYDKEND